VHGRNDTWERWEDTSVDRYLQMSTQRLVIYVLSGRDPGPDNSLPRSAGRERGKKTATSNFPFSKRKRVVHGRNDTWERWEDTSVYRYLQMSTQRLVMYVLSGRDPGPDNSLPLCRSVGNEVKNTQHLNFLIVSGNLLCTVVMTHGNDGRTLP
jgi:ribosomal protein S10